MVPLYQYIVVCAHLTSVEMEKLLLLFMLTIFVVEEG